MLRARYIRADLYNLRAAVRAHCLLDPDNSTLAEQYVLMENVVIKQEDNKLFFSCRKYTNEEHIRAALHPDAKLEDIFK